jgi:hypothetical protein
MYWVKNLFFRCLATIMIGGAMLGPGIIATAEETQSSDGMEVMTRGPVHEAFAETVVFDPKPGIIVPKQPPAMIEEIPPDHRPEGDNVAWIPGYWAWDDDKNDFIWVSGVWRNLPPGREWVPGYWSKVDNGHQWTSGYWQDAEADEVTYLPEPPRSLETGPSTPAPSEDETWIPGSWEYRDDRYAWRSGYWAPAREDWIWTPSYYRWTNRGYVYVDGYWDYPIEDRGVLFAPVYFSDPYYARSDYYYSPFTAISLGVFWNHLFVSPSYGHYYFGDYYDWRYRDRCYPAYNYGWHHRGYDPIFAHHRWEHRGDRNWTRDRHRDFESRRDNPGARPPRTFVGRDNRPEWDRRPGNDRVAERFDRVVSSRENGGRRFQAVSGDERQRFVSQRNQVRSFARDRERLEIGVRPQQAGKEGVAKLTREKVNRSPVVARTAEGAGNKMGAPPPRLERRASEERAIATRGQAAPPVQSNREMRTQPGTRRDAVAAPRANTMADGRNEQGRSAAVRGNPEARRIEDRALPPRPQQRETPARQATPTPNRRSIERAAPQRKMTPAPSRQSTQRATPQRSQVRPQPMAQPQRQFAPRHQTQRQPQRAAPRRSSASAPQRQTVAPRQQQSKSSQYRTESYSGSKSDSRNRR